MNEPQPGICTSCQGALNAAGECVNEFCEDSPYFDDSQDETDEEEADEVEDDGA